MKYCTVCKEKYDDSVSFCPVDGEVLEGDPASLVDTVLDGQYQMEALLGKGGMGAVYRARHILLGDRVAIKVLPPDLRTNSEWLRRFRREGQAARRFRHPNAVTVYDLRTAADGTIYMVMEYVEGHTLDAEIRKRGRFTAAEAYEILTPIMSVLDTAHSMGVVHRDLKPENIMIGNPTGNSGPMVKLLDLGIAKMREIAGVETSGNTALTMAGQVLGTPYYMSPEQWGEIPRDENLEIDGRADIYSLGLVFYEMIAGRRCYSGNTLHELRREHVSTVAKPLSEVVPDVPLGFSAAIHRATAKDRADRQPTASVLSEELRAGLNTSSLGITGDVRGLSETLISPGGIETRSDLDAPTLIEPGASSTAVADSPRETTPFSSAFESVASFPESKTVSTAISAASPPDGNETAPTVLETADMGSVVTVQQPRRIVEIAPPPQTKSQVRIVVALVLGVMILGGLGIGGVWLYSRLSSKPVPPDTPGTNGAVSAPSEISRYWLMLEPSGPQGTSTRVAGLVPVASGQAFQMRFVFAAEGYVYIFGPGGETNQPTAFLTTKPAPESGVTSNLALAGSEFSFPAGDGLLKLDKRPGTDRFTVVFCKSRLESPSFLSVQVTGDPLTASEVADFKAFVSKYMQKPPETELDETNNQAPFVRVKADAEQLNSPIVFEIRIQHN